MSASVASRARRANRPPLRPRWLLIADISRPRIEVAAAETINGVMTGRTFEARGATRADALAELSRLVSEAGGVAAWEAPLRRKPYPLAYRDWFAEQAANPPDERLRSFFEAALADVARARS
jgi:hypothetical protein